MSVGTQIMYNRKLKKLTQEKLGDLLGISYMTVRRWETGKSNPDIAELQKISNVLDVPIEQLLDKESPESSSDKDISLSYTNEHSQNKGMAIYTSKDGQRFEVPATPEGYAFLRDMAATIANREPVTMRTPAMA